MSKGLMNSSKLFDAVIAARPAARAADARRLAPGLAHLPDADLEARLEQARRRRAKLTTVAGNIPVTGKVAGR